MSIYTEMTGVFEQCYMSGLKVRSHQTRMKRYARIIYMLSQWKDTIDNPAARKARVEKSEFWRIFAAR